MNGLFDLLKHKKNLDLVVAALYVDAIGNATGLLHYTDDDWIELAQAAKDLLVDLKYTYEEIEEILDVGLAQYMTKEPEDNEWGND